MPSTLKRTQRRALTLSRSFVNMVGSKLFSGHNEACSPFENPLRTPVIPKTEISRPRQLRRGRVPIFMHMHFMHRLPVEILAHVFVLGSEDDVMLPVYVSHVCSAWREIALRTPSLWRRISLSPETDMWRVRIHRARACSLDIQLLSWISTRRGYRGPQLLDVHTVQWHMHLVTPFIRHWRSLEIVFTEYSPFLWNAALSGCSSKSSRVWAIELEDLSLVYHANDDTKEFCLFSGFAPRLRRATIDGIRLTWLPSLFGNLTYLDYTHHGFTADHQAVHDVISILEVSDRLVELRVLFPRKRGTLLPSRIHPARRRVLLASLTHLHLRVEGADIPFELAHLMTLVLTPCLATLWLVDLDHRPHSFSNLKSFFYVYPMSPTIRTLHIEHGWYDPHMVSPLLYPLSNIRRLVLRRLHSPDQVYNLNSRTRKGHYCTENACGHMHFRAHSDSQTSGKRR